MLESVTISPPIENSRFFISIPRPVEKAVDVPPPILVPNLKGMKSKNLYCVPKVKIGSVMLLLISLNPVSYTHLRAHET